MKRLCPSILLVLALAGCAGTMNLDGRPAPSGIVSTGASLNRFYDEGVASGSGSTTWVHVVADAQQCDFNTNLIWGSVFIVVDQVTGVHRQVLDFSRFTNLVVELKGATGGESVQLGVKTETDPDDGTEPLAPVSGLTTDWQTYTVPLSSLVNASHPASRFTHLYVVFEIVFTGVPTESVSFRNIRFE